MTSNADTIPQAVLRYRDSVWTRMIAALILAVVVVAVFSRAFWCGFITLDDRSYIVNNPDLTHGLSWKGIEWACTSKVLGLWHPMTLLSLLADYQFFGFAAAGYHIHNVVLHAINVGLLLHILSKITGDIERSTLVAALFGLHPLRVESVVWVVERKDVLSTFFVLLSILLHVYYLIRPRAWKHILCCVFFALSLMAKPMYVTLPAFLLVLDFWPLRRWKIEQGWTTATRMFAEKWTLAIIAVAFSPMIDYLSSLIFTGKPSIAGVPEVEDNRSLFWLGNSLVSYWRYLGEMFWFENLTISHAEIKWSLLAVTVAAIGLLVVTVAVFLRRKNFPWLAAGWVWFLLILLPVNNIRPVGPTSIAERYTYFSSIGITLMLVWSIPNSWFLAPVRRWILGLTILAVLTLLSVETWRQTGYWLDSRDLFTQALLVGGESGEAYHAIGMAYHLAGQRSEAISSLRRWVELQPLSADAHSDLATELMLMDPPQNLEAAAEFDASLKLHPEVAYRHQQIMIPLLQIADASEPPNRDLYELAYKHGQEALRLHVASARLPLLHNLLGMTLLRLGDLHGAELYFQTALSINPAYVSAQKNLEDLYNHMKSSKNPAARIPSPRADESKAPQAITK